MIKMAFFRTICSLGVLVCVFTDLAHSLNRHNIRPPGQASGLYQRETVLGGGGDSTPKQVVNPEGDSETVAHTPVVDRLLFLHKYLSGRNRDDSPQSSAAPGVYVDSRRVTAVELLGDKCLVYAVDAGHHEATCQDRNSQHYNLARAEMWLGADDVANLLHLPRGEEEGRPSFTNLSVTVHHKNPDTSRTHRTQRFLGYSSVDTSVTGLTRKPWLLVDLGNIRSFVTFAMKRRRPLYVEVCKQDVSNGAGTPPTSGSSIASQPMSSSGNRLTGTSAPQVNGFFLAAHHGPEQSLTDFITACNISVTIRPVENAQSTRRQRRSAETMATAPSASTPSAANQSSSSHNVTGVPPANASQATTTSTSQEPALHPNSNENQQPDNTMSNSTTASNEVPPPVPEDEERLCGTEDFRMYFGEKIFRPRWLVLTACTGRCTNEVSALNVFTALKRLSRRASTGGSIGRREECCVPYEFHKGELSLVVWDRSDQPRITPIKDYRVKSCRCS